MVKPVDPLLAKLLGAARGLVAARRRELSTRLGRAREIRLLMEIADIRTDIRNMESVVEALTTVEAGKGRSEGREGAKGQ